MSRMDEEESGESFSQASSDQLVLDNFSILIVNECISVLLMEAFH